MNLLFADLWGMLHQEWKKTGVLLALAALLAWAGNALRSEPLPWFKPLSLESGQAGEWTVQDVVRAYYDENACLIDLRPEKDYAHAHLAASLNLPLQGFQNHLEQYYDRLPAQGRVILFNTAQEPEVLEEARDQLAMFGFRYSDIILFRPGWEALQTQKAIPIVKGSGHE